MNIHIHIHHHNHGDDKLFTEIKSINTKQNKMAQEIENLTEEVRENTDLTQSSITLMNGIKARLDEALANQDWAKVQTLSADIAANNDALAAAIAANTPADPGTGTDNGGTTDPGTTPGGTDPNANL